MFLQAIPLLVLAFASPAMALADDAPAPAVAQWTTTDGTTVQGPVTFAFTCADGDGTAPAVATASPYIVLSSSGDPQQRVVVAQVAASNGGALSDRAAAELAEAKALNAAGAAAAARTKAGSAAAKAADEKAAQAWASVSAAAEFPKVYIGVRISPVPAPLAAHIGEKGAMIANIVRDSPADRAGLQQYDVVTSVGDKKIDGPMDLTEALRGLSAGTPVTLTLMRKSTSQEVAVTLEDRPTDVPTEMKYDEPEASVLDNVARIRGRALQMGPNGVWQMRDLGDLDNLSDMLKELDLQRKFNFFQQSDPNDNTDEQVQINVVVKNDDGTSVSVQSATDGTIEVTRTDADGAETSATYNSPEELQAGDAEAFKLYNEHVRQSGPRVMLLGPDGSGLGKQYRVEIHRKLEEAMKNADEQMQRAHEQMQEAMERMHQQMRQIRIKQGPNGNVEESSESFSVNQKPDGSVHVIIIENGDKKAEYHFNSIDALKKGQPDVYEKVKDFLK